MRYARVCLFLNELSNWRQSFTLMLEVTFSFSVYLFFFFDFYVFLFSFALPVMSYNISTYLQAFKWKTVITYAL